MTLSYYEGFLSARAEIVVYSRPNFQKSAKYTLDEGDSNHEFSNLRKRWGWASN